MVEDLDRLLESGARREAFVFDPVRTAVVVVVESTLRDAFYRDYQCLLLTDCCAEAIGADESRTNHDASLAVIEALFGWTTESDRFLSALGTA